MKEFKKWLANDITKEYPLYQDKDGYTIGNTKALKAGWKAALEWALKEMEKDREQGWPIEASKITIRKELKEE